METETQVQPEMPVPGQSIESNEQKSKRGGKRPGAGRKKNPVTILLKGTSRTTLLQALENVDPQLVAAKITKLLQSKREIIWLQTLNFIYDRGLKFLSSKESISAGAKAASEWCKAAIELVRQAAEPNPWKNASDEEIAGELLRRAKAAR